MGVLEGFYRDPIRGSFEKLPDHHARCLRQKSRSLSKRPGEPEPVRQA